MMYQSTRGATPESLDEALLRGIASDGGLFLPTPLPQFSPGDFSSSDSMLDTARTFLYPFFQSSSLESALDDIISETFHFPIPLSDLATAGGYGGLLELFHGPTAAFKDVGAGFLAACLSRLQADTNNPLTILVATSGDTGGAVAAAFDRRPGIRVVVLYPDGRVSERQAHQLTCWSENVLSLAVSGAFDDCQAMVKQAMADDELSRRYRFSSANSINIGRLMPQTIYYAHTALQRWFSTDRKPGFIVPTGNLGNAFACYIARHMGLPIGDIVLATNANRVIVDFLDSGTWSPGSSVETLASAMDVGNPSNMERLRSLGGDAGKLRGSLRAVSVNDDQIRQQIKHFHDQFGVTVCPHTATATFAWGDLDVSERKAKDWILVATAHAAKFEEIVEPIIDEAVPLPAELAEILARPRQFVEIEPNSMALAEAIHDQFAS